MESLTLERPSPGGLVTTQTAGPTLCLTRRAGGGAQGFAFLTCFRVKLKALVLGPHLEKGFSGADFPTRHTNIVSQIVVCRGAVLCIAGCLAASLAPTHSIPVAPPLYSPLAMTTKNASR